MDKSYFERNVEWTVSYTSVSTDTLSLQSILKFGITIQRKSTFHGLNTIAPLVILLTLNPLVFILPPQSAERINFSETILLSFVVLLTVFTDVLPTNSEPMAAINCIMIATLCISSLCVLLTIIQLHLYHKSDEFPVPRNLAQFVKCFKCCKTVCKKKSNQNETEIHMIDADDDDYMTWNEVAAFLDRIYVILGYIGINTYILTVMAYMTES
ncbi:5-hydroxytryptamine receptor 3A [Mizuhopecten yessoensis]|uniref:5-hydroxytryptamine receptor 3A n=1 Tax=Mizuhopecten yessoensis TaxID=6573 RepID=A0A210PR79_MIZYE|nr:5-hydroxytryptamine receptor 3A [Mizuhopecten yessoensis]